MFGNGHPVFAISSGKSHDACNTSAEKVMFCEKTKCSEAKNGRNMRAGLSERATDEGMSKVYECVLPFILSSPCSFLAFSFSHPCLFAFPSWSLPILLSFLFFFCARASERVHMFLCVSVRAVAYVYAFVLVLGRHTVTQRTLFSGQYLCTSELGNSRPAHRLYP